MKEGEIEIVVLMRRADTHAIRIIILRKDIERLADRWHQRFQKMGIRPSPPPLTSCDDAAGVLGYSIENKRDHADCPFEEISPPATLVVG